MRVLFETYPWAFATPGGGEMQIMHYRDHLPRHGITVRMHDTWRPCFDDVDVVHFFSCIGGSVHFCRYVRDRGLPLVVSSSLWITAATRQSYPMEEIRAQLASADVIVPNSVTEADTLAVVLGLPRERFMPVMNGFDERFACPADPARFRTAFGLPGPFLLSVANIEPRKNQLGLVRAIRGLGLPLVLVGHIRDRDYAAAVLIEGDAALRYVGPLAQEDEMLASAYAACSVLVLPSTLETPGLAALEAAAAGASVVITGEGAAREYFGGLARYVDHTDPADIRGRIREALAAPPDPALRAHVIANFTWPMVTAELANVYREAASRRSRSG